LLRPELDRVRVLGWAGGLRPCEGLLLLGIESRVTLILRRCQIAGLNALQASFGFSFFGPVALATELINLTSGLRIPLNGPGRSTKSAEQPREHGRRHYLNSGSY
jgi:hypothetical protein